MIIYKHQHLPALRCFLRNGYVHMYPEYKDLNHMFESTFKKIYDEKDITDYLDKIFSDEKQIDALLYCIVNM